MRFLLVSIIGCALCASGLAQSPGPTGGPVRAQAVADPHIDRIRAFLARREFPEALAQANLAIAEKPQDVNYCLHKGLALGYSGQHRLALVEFDRCIALNPHHAWLWSNRSIAKRSVGDKAGSLQDIDEALRLAPDNPDFLFARATVYRDLGNSLEARRNLNQALVLNPNLEGARAALRELPVDASPVGIGANPSGGDLGGNAGEAQAQREMKERLQRALGEIWNESGKPDRLLAACKREGENMARYGLSAAGAAAIRDDQARIQSTLDRMKLVYKYFYDLRTTENRRSVAQANRLISELQEKFTQDAVTQVTTVLLMPGPVTTAGQLALEIHNGIVDLVGHKLTTQDGHVQDAASLAQTGRTLQQLDALVKRYDRVIQSLVPAIRQMQRVRALLGDCAVAFGASPAGVPPSMAVPMEVQPVARYHKAMIVLNAVYLQEQRTTHEGTSVVKGGSTSIGNEGCPAIGAMQGRTFQGQIFCKPASEDTYSGELSITLGQDPRFIEAFSLKAVKRSEGQKITLSESLVGRAIPFGNFGSSTLGKGHFWRSFNGLEACQYLTKVGYEVKSDSNAYNMVAVGHSCFGGAAGSTGLSITLDE